MNTKKYFLIPVLGLFFSCLYSNESNAQEKSLEFGSEKVGFKYIYLLDEKRDWEPFLFGRVAGDRIAPDGKAQRAKCAPVAQNYLSEALAAATARSNTEKQHESEKRKLNAGLSDVYKVLGRRTSMMNAHSAEIQAQTELNKAIAELQRATGNSLKDNWVETKLVK